MTQITFHGAAETVTGSKYLLESNGSRVFVDCGLFQGIKRLRELNWEPLPVDPSTIDAVVLSHAHLDHVGYLPRLVRDGFRGTVFGTKATHQLAEIILLDSAKNQERDAEYANRKGYSRHRPALPLYTTEDAQTAIGRLKAQDRGEWFCPCDPFWFRFHDAGHLLGSNMVEVENRSVNPPLRLLFSGDVGRYDAPLYHDPAPPPDCDYLICESTYGDRDHPPGHILDNLAEAVNRGIERGGVILMASFAVGRAQQLIYLLQVLMSQQRIARIPIFLDSPMSVNATDVYYEHRHDHDLSEGELRGRHTVLKGRNVHLSKTTEQSKRLNRVQLPAVIISSSGMMTGGRILHHLRRRLPDPKTTVLLGGFMAAGTRGRRLYDGEPTIRIHGKDVPVKATVETISGLSGHADRRELQRWLADLQTPRRTFLTHGETSGLEAMARTLQEQRGWNVVIPKLGETYTLGADSQP